MSDYVRIKAVRYKIPLRDGEDINIDDLEEKYQINTFGDKINDFNVNYGYNYKEKKSEYYLDYLLDYEYGASGEFESTRQLTENEYKKYKELFKKYISYVEPSNLRIVHYSYYNGCDAPSVFDFQEEL